MISRPANAHFDLPLDLLQTSSPCSPKSPNGYRNGSFGVTYGGLNQPTLAELREEDAGFDDLDAPIRRVNGAFTPTPYSPSLEAAVIPNVETIARAIRDLIRE